MNKQTLKNLTHAHGWLGIIISGFLFLIFLAGSITLFKDDIHVWEIQPHFSPNFTADFNAEKSDYLPVSKIMEIAIAGRDFNAKEHLTVIPPLEEIPYYRVYVDLNQPYKGEDHIGLLIDPYTGEIMGEVENFFLSDFFYHLHYDLNAPYGMYFLGVVTLLFFIMLLSGITIHLKNIIKRFFQYRAGDHTRSRMLDIHSAVGTISIPFTLMYAITGLIFNMTIVYQIAFAVILYKGDQTKLLEDAGVYTLAPKWQDTPIDYKNIDLIIEKTNQKYGEKPWLFRMYNYGDKSAVLHMMGNEKNGFEQRFEIAYNLNDESIALQDGSPDQNAVGRGINVMASLHFANFAGLDLRIIYFVLSVFVCALIVTGNLLWLEKRYKNKQYSARSVNVLSHLTLVSTVGLVFASSVAFLLARVLDVEFSERASWVIYGFIITLFSSSAMAFILTPRRMLIGLLAVSAAVLFTVVLLDFTLYADYLSALWQQNMHFVFAVDAGLLFVALSLAAVSYFVYKKGLLKREEIKENTAV